MPVAVRLKASLDGKHRGGRYSAVLGTERQRQGEVTASPGSQERLRDLSSPVLPLQAPWRAFLVLGEETGGKMGN